jgi:hypothetical protein
VDRASLAHPARASTQASPLEHFAEAVEKELARLAAARPHLEDRIGRAAQLCVVQLSSAPRNRPIKCRVRKGGRPVLLVSSLAAGGVTYQVNPGSWECSCPDWHRRSAACKHGLAGWVLWRASLTRQVGAHVDQLDEINARQEAARRSHDEDAAASQEGGEDTCAHCMGSGWIYMGTEDVDPSTGEVIEAVNPVRSRRCQAVEPPYLTDEQLQEWMESVRWRYARTMPKHPHDYSLKEWNDEQTFLRVVQTIWDCGYDRLYLRRPWRSLDVGDYYIWVCSRPESPRQPAPLKETELVNRAVRVQTELLGREGAL